MNQSIFNKNVPSLQTASRCPTTQRRNLTHGSLNVYFTCFKLFFFLISNYEYSVVVLCHEACWTVDDFHFLWASFSSLRGFMVATAQFVSTHRLLLSSRAVLREWQYAVTHNWGKPSKGKGPWRGHDQLIGTPVSQLTELPAGVDGSPKKLREWRVYTQLRIFFRPLICMIHRLIYILLVSFCKNDTGQTRLFMKSDKKKSSRKCWVDKRMV